MKGDWPTYRMILEENNNKLTLKKFEEIRLYLTDQLQYFQLNERLSTDLKKGFENKTSDLGKEVIQSKGKYISKMYNLYLEWEVKEKVKERGDGALGPRTWI